MVRPLVTIVDDDPSVRKALARLLTAASFEVDCFASAQDFLATGLARAPVCLVLDIHLGGMSGFELHDHLAAAGARVPAIFITAHDDAATRARAAQVGAAAYLRKPFDQHALLRAIYQAMGQAPGP
jgi:FixJ family two-component response regulator